MDRDKELLGEIKITLFKADCEVDISHKVDNMAQSVLSLIKRREIEARIDELNAPYIQINCVKSRIEQLQSELREVEALANIEPLNVKE